MINRIIRIVLIFILGTICYNSFGQSTFSKKILLNFLNYWSPYAWLELDEAPGGGYYFGGGNLVGKMDYFGNVQWCRQITRPYPNEGGALVSLASHDNGNVAALIRVDTMVAGSFYYKRTFIVCFDANGNHIFTKKYVKPGPHTDNLPTNIIKDESGFAITLHNIITQTSTNQEAILRIDSSGNKINSVFTATFYYPAILKITSGNYFIYASNTIIKSDSAFVNQIEMTLPNYLHHIHGIIQLTDSTFIGYGGDVIQQNSFVFKFNSQMQIEWFNTYQLPASSNLGAVQRGIRAPDNSLMFLVENYSSGSTPDAHPYIMRLDSSGNVLAVKMINIYGTDVNAHDNKSSDQNGLFTFICSERDTNSSFSMTGFRINSVDTSLSLLCDAIDTTVLKTPQSITPLTNPPIIFSNSNDILITDSMTIVDYTFLYSSCDDSTLNINFNSNSTLDLKIFPNPATSTIQLTLNTKHNAPLECEIINMRGERVFTSPLTPLLWRGESYAVLDVSFLAKGIYLVRVGDGSQWENKKLVVE